MPNYIWQIVALILVVLLVVFLVNALGGDADALQQSYRR